jgi:Zn-finger nucleic acid-binding protein
MVLKKNNNKIKTVYGEELLNCPRDNVPMRKLKKNNVVIDICKKCGGMWLDAGEIDKLAGMAQPLKKCDKNGKK